MSLSCVGFIYGPVTSPPGAGLPEFGGSPPIRVQGLPEVGVAAPVLAGKMSSCRTPIVLLLDLMLRLYVRHGGLLWSGQLSGDSRLGSGRSNA